MSVHPLDPDDPTAPFEQLRAQVARRAASGELAAGTRLPTVRALAEHLGVAPGTVARAYRELEADGIVVTEGRRGTSVSVAPRAGVDESAARDAAATLATTARRSGLTREETHRLLDAAWPT